MTTSRWSKFTLLLWKNWVIQKRHYVQTLFEILIPVLCCAMLILVRSLVDPDEVTTPTIFESLRTDTLSELSTVSPPVSYQIAYSPKNDVLEVLVSAAVAQMRGLFQLSVLAMDTARDMQAEVLQRNLVAGIEFPVAYTNITNLPDKLDFSLRFPSELRITGLRFGNWRTNFLIVPFVQGIRNPESTDGGSPSYIREGFITVQSALSRAFIQLKSPNVELPEVRLSRYPYPPFYEDQVLLALERLLPLIILISFFYTCISTVKHITIEKEKQLKEAMKIMGLPNWLHWMAWFVRCIILLFISVALVVFMLSANLTSNTNLSVLEYTEWSVLWFFFFTYIIATICFCFMMSVFFNKANTAAGIAGLMWFLFSMPFNITLENYDEMGTGEKLLVCLLSNSAMSYGIMNVVRLEGTQTGLHWSNLFSEPTMGDQLSVGVVIVMFLVDSLLYLTIALYVEQIAPGEFGVARKWYFPFTKEFWRRNRVADGDPSSAQLKSETSKYIEQDPVGLVAGVQIKNLRKVYGKKVAVEGLSLNMYNSQITVLLGHNGAGKTTTMSMLTGMFSPTSGTASVNGYDIRHDIEGVRFSLGLCPQHNVLFNELTVAEHLQFFSQLKGVPRKLTNQQIDKYVNLLELADKRHAQSHTLSGGMKRKLGVGIALCGDSKVVLLDEPTSGMDPSARRALWDLVQKEKSGRTILLSTHFMDEADVLGDRIAIMAEGNLKAVGSPFFLKKNLGAGYRLICVKDEHCDKHRLLAILRQYIPDIKVETDIGTELTFVLKEEYLKVFQRMLEELEQNMAKCGVSSYGISLTTMEEVFLKTGSDSNVVKEDEADANGHSLYLDGQSDSYSLDNLRLLTGSKRLLNQIRAQFIKKALTTIRSWITLSMQLIIPVIFAIVSYIIILNSSAGRELPPLPITLDRYTQSVTVLEYNSTMNAAGQAYRQGFEGRSPSHRLDVASSNMIDYILMKSTEDIATINTRYWVGASLDAELSTAWFNNRAYHTAPLAISLLYNALLQSVCPTCEISVSNKPLPYQLATQFRRLQTGANAGFQLAFNTGFAMAFVSALYILFYIKERVSRAKLLQFVSGVNVSLFWGISFFWDYLVFIVSALLYIATLAIIQQDGWSSFDQLGRVLLVLLFFGYACLPVTYLFAYLFHVPATGFVKMMLLNVLSGTVFLTTVTLLRFEGIDLNNVADILEWIFMFFPNFVLGQTLDRLNFIGTAETLCMKTCEQFPLCTPELLCTILPECCGTDVFTFGKNGINRSILFLVAIGTVGIALVLFIDYRVLKKIFSRRTDNPTVAENDAIDSDVWEEKRKIANCSDAELASYNLVLRELSKYYGKFVAVNKLSVGVHHAECFGLLGINGAGKTSTFKMMTGDENISSGEAWVNGISLKTDMNRVHQQIGYCPQFDALLEELTGRETLKIFSLMRGVRNEEVNGVLLTLAEELNFVKHLDKRTKAYSGGNKRKLSTALALLGNPSVVYLDEPTTGMDPGAKRQFWDVICKIRSSGKSIVLTSHSMEECEALCTRLAIMVNGEFKCLGSTQHLKNKFSKGFLLTVKLKRDHTGAADAVKAFVDRQFPGAVLKEEYQDSLTLQIVQTNLRWSAMFGLMESSKDALGIEDYALGQTSLEQVFLFFTKYQRETE